MTHPFRKIMKLVRFLPSKRNLKNETLKKKHSKFNFFVYDMDCLQGAFLYFIQRIYSEPKNLQDFYVSLG